MKRSWKIDRDRVSALLAARSDPAQAVFENLTVGARFGPYNEKIVRLERRPLAVTPTWFDPREHPGHIGLHNRRGVAVYLDLELDHAARAAGHPFDVEILGLQRGAVLATDEEAAFIPSASLTLFDLGGPQACG
jgi:hypothetical protein